jgi:opacity protein-like surface antigen
MKKCLLATLLSLGLMSAAHATGEGFYLGLNGIYADMGLSDITEDDTTYTTDGTTTIGGGASAGFNTSENFALELGIDGLDGINYSGDDAPSISSFWFGYADIKPMIQKDWFVGFLKVGAAYVAYKTDLNSGDVDSSMVRPLGAIGFGINVSESTELDLSINYIQDTDTPITYGMFEFTHHFVTKYDTSGFILD